MTAHKCLGLLIHATKHLATNCASDLAIAAKRALHAMTSIALIGPLAFLPSPYTTSLVLITLTVSPCDSQYCSILVMAVLRPFSDKESSVELSAKKVHSSSKADQNITIDMT